MGFRNTRSLEMALAMMRYLSSGVAIKWCGSLPTGMRLVSVMVALSMRLTVPSPEFNTTATSARANAANIIASNNKVFPENRTIHSAFVYEKAGAW